MNAMRVSEWKLVLYTLFLLSGSIRAPDDRETQSLLLGSFVDGGQVEYVTGDDGLDSVITGTGIDASIEDVLREWNLPIISVGIIKQNKTLAKGYGYSKLPGIPMNPETLFYCGSTTKSFTAAAMSILVDDDYAFPHIQWTTPMSQLLTDDFVLSDEWATNHVTIEDALSHRTGYPGHTLDINNTSPQETVRRLRYLAMSAEPRTTYQYSNYMFTAVGYLIEVLTGLWLGDFFRERLWEPMGMHHTYLTLEDAEESDLPLAAEYRWNNDTDSFIHVHHLPNGRSREAAGMIISNVLDYTRYLRVMMAEEFPLSKMGHEAIRTPRTIMGEYGAPYTGPLYYGFGWVSGVLEGERFWFHNGQIREHTSQMWMFPEKGFALVTLANAESPASDIIALRIIYDALEIENHSRWDIKNAARLRERQSAKALETCVSRLYPRVPDPAIIRPVSLRNFTGTFHNLGYGNTTISLECALANPFPEGTSPVHLTLDQGCYLRTDSAMGLEGRSFHIVFEHVTGDFWVGWVIIDEHSPIQQPGQLRPTLCTRAEFHLDDRGIVKYAGLDMRQEGEAGPLIWYERVK